MTDDKQDGLLNRFRNAVKESDSTKAEIAAEIGVTRATLRNWLKGSNVPRTPNKRRVQSWMDGDLSPANSCRVRGCEEPPEYCYENPHSGAPGRFCQGHMDTRHPELDATDWMDLGYARVIS